MNNAVNIDPTDLASCGVVNDPKSLAQSLFREIEKPAHIGTSGFFDPTNPDDPEASVQIVLERVESEGKELFRLKEPIGYWDEHIGGIVVPHNLAHFFTDLTSVPQLMTWLIPRTGTHLPAALIHDGLISDPDEPRTYVAREPISRVEADRVFRDAMKDLQTTWVSRWLIWTGVAAASKTKKVVEVDSTGEVAEEIEGLAAKASNFASTQRLWGWLVVLLTVLTVAVLGTIATLEITDCWNVVPGMADQTMLVELAVGLTAAVVIPAFLSGLWGSQWRAGVIAGIALSLLLHVMAALVVIFGLFKTADHVSAGRIGHAILWFASSVTMVSIVATIIALVCR